MSSKRISVLPVRITGKRFPYMSEYKGNPLRTKKYTLILYMNPQMTQAKPELLMYAKTHKLLSLDFEI
jgi:hypothetical protein